MPQKYSVKTYVEEGCYHVYNRGVNKYKIFRSAKDYKVFLSYLKSALLPPPDSKSVKRKIVTINDNNFDTMPKLPKNFCGEIDLLAYCLMPNHFHLLLKQSSKNSMQAFMRSVITRYSMYFNKQHSRVGRLFQGSYKAVYVNKDDYLLHLSRYIHLNPSNNASVLESAYSSYADYLGHKNSKWIKPMMVLSFFDQAKLPFQKGINTYQNFVENYKIDSEAVLGNLTLE